MPNGASAAVTEAARLDEIGFPEFTAKLITDTFDSLVAANIRQTQSYMELLQAVAKTLGTYIEETEDDISGGEILQFLAKTLPPGDPTSDDPSKVKIGETLADTDVVKLNAALHLPDEASVPNNNEAAQAVQLTDVLLEEIRLAVARRLAANKYDLLKEMVKQGILRLVVENGLVETRLTFTTYGSTFYQKHTTDYHRDSFKFRAKARTGGFVSLWVKASASTSYTNVNVRTANETHRDITGSRVQTFGAVEIRFKTDFLPLPG